MLVAPLLLQVCHGALHIVELGGHRAERDQDFVLSFLTRRLSVELPLQHLHLGAQHHGFLVRFGGGTTGSKEPPQGEAEYESKQDSHESNSQ